MQALIKNMIDTENTFQANTYTLKYFDSKLEREYLIRHNKFVMNFGKILQLEVLILNILDMLITIISYSEGSIDRMVILKVFLISAALQLMIFIHYKSCTHSLMHSQLFSPIQMVALTIGLVEKILLRNLGLDETSNFMIGLVCVNITFLVLSYSQIYMLISIICISVYTFVRFFTYQDLPIFDYLRQNLILSCVSPIFIIFGRAFQQREREQFCLKQGYKQLSKLFHNLVKVFNDGIIIANESEIIYSNKQAYKIFGVSTRK